MQTKMTEILKEKTTKICCRATHYRKCDNGRNQQDFEVWGKLSWLSVDHRKWKKRDIWLTDRWSDLANLRTEMSRDCYQTTLLFASTALRFYVYMHFEPDTYLPEYIILHLNIWFVLVFMLSYFSFILFVSCWWIDLVLWFHYAVAV